jgi:hypothetical protein
VQAWQEQPIPQRDGLAPRLIATIPGDVIDAST